MSKHSTSSDLCVCKICNCGRHHCPHQSIRSVALGPCSLSEYTDQYIPRPIYQVQSFKPLANYSRNNEPLEDKTNHRIDFVPHPLEKRFVKQRDPYKPTDGEFEKHTTYTSEFNPKNGERVMMFKRKPERKELGKFEGIPTYKNDYPGWPASPREIYGKKADWIPPTESFNGIPTYVSDYIKYNDPRPRESFKPCQETQIADIPFQDMTEMRQSYISHPLDVRKSKEKAEWFRPSVPFTGESTFTSDFKEKPLSLSKSFKPPAIAKLSSEPLQNETTHNMDYKPWGIERPFHHQAEKYVPPEGTMLTDTTYLRDFLPQRPEKVAAFKPKNLRESLSQFDAKTSYSLDFKQWEVAARQRFGPNREYIPSDIPFEKKTTHGTHFVAMPLSVRPSYKQSNQTHLSNAPFDGESIYRSEYTHKEINICPTVIMGSPRAPYEYTGEIDNKGHRLVASRKPEEITSTSEVTAY